MDYKDEFEKFRKLYPGVKRGLNTELDCFQKKHKDWKQVVPLLIPALKDQINRRRIDTYANRFVPPWKHLKTWIYNRCWEEVVGTIETLEEKAEKAKKEREKERNRLREKYQRYLESKSLEALKDIKADNGYLAYFCSWLIDEIIEKRQGKI